MRFKSGFPSRRTPHTSVESSAADVKGPLRTLKWRPSWMGDVATFHGTTISSAPRTTGHDWGLEAGYPRYRLRELALLDRDGVDVGPRKPGGQLRDLRAQALRVPHQDGEETSSGSVPSVSAVAGTSAVPGPRLVSRRLPAAVGHGGGRVPVDNHSAGPAARSADLGLPVGLTLPRNEV